MLDRLQSFTIDHRPENSPRVVQIDSDSAQETIKGISSKTAREIVALLHEDPRPISKIAEALDTSIPNVKHHLDNLEQADLITEVDTWYSEKGREMKIYAPTDDPLVFAGTKERTGRVQSLLQQVGAAVVMLGLASVLVQLFVSDFLIDSQQSETIRKATGAGAIEGVNLTPIPPGVLFFTGGTFILAITVLVWYVSTSTR